MELVLETGPVTLYKGDCREVMKTLPDNSVDSIVTDPPYELGFMGKGWDSSGIAFDPVVWAEAYRVLKPGGHVLAFGATRLWHRLAVAIEEAGFEIRDSIAWMYGQGFPKSMDIGKAVTALDRGYSAEAGGIRRATEEDGGEMVFSENGETWRGWGTSLKPAFEPIIMARKPMRQSIAANVLEYGTGALNIDASRLPTDEDLTFVPKSIESASRGRYGLGGVDTIAELKKLAARGEKVPHGEPAIRVLERIEQSIGVRNGSTNGRFPSNVILDESQAAALEEQTGILTSGLMKAGTVRKPRSGGAIYGADKRNIVASDTYADSVGASRFFYVAKASSAERPEVDGKQHSTVKPLALMRYLVKLVTPPNGVALDLFAGSGTTLEAAVLEGFDVIGIELDEDGTHIPLIEKRLGKPLTPAMF